jgi:DNA-binding winged helix-turn-helix (wHTH) protein/tetratricopeptide (TPR) repeat protein
LEHCDSFHIDKWLIEPQLNRISNEQQEVILVPKVMSLLLLLVEHAGEPVSQQTILDHIWPEQVVSDSSIYQAIAQLRKAFGDSARKKYFIERVSGKGYRLIAKVSEQSKEAFSHPVTDIEIKNKTNITSSTDTFSVSTMQSTFANKKTLAIIFTTILCLSFLLIAYFKGFEQQSTNSPQSSRKTQSKLPFAINDINSIGLINLTISQASTSTNLEALNDVLLTQLMHFKDIQIINLKSAVHSVDTQAIISGNITTQKAELRVYLKLEHTETQQIIWAKQFTGRTDNIFAMQDEIVADLLQLFNRQQPIDTFNKSNIDTIAFDQYLLARYLWDQRDVKSLKRSQQLFESLQNNNQLFPLAAVGLCNTYQYLHIYSDWTLNKALSMCKPLLDQALAQQPDLGQALAAKALLLSHQGGKSEAKILFEKAINLAPNYAFGYMWYSSLLRDLGQYSLSLEYSKKAYKLSPMSPIINRNLAYSMLNLREMSQARYYYQRALELDPDYTDRAVGELDFFSLNSQRAKAFITWLETNQSKLTKQPNFALTKAQIDLALGDLDSAIATVKASEEISVNPSFLLFIKLAIATAQGEHKKALDLLTKREKLHNLSQIFSVSRVIILSQMGEYKVALDTLLQSNPEISKTETTVTEQNIEIFLLYHYLQRHISQQAKLTKAQLNQLALLFNAQQKTSTSQAQWYLLQGDITKSKEVVLNMLTAGWLPDYNSDMYPEARMKKLFIDTGLGEIKYGVLLENNRYLVTH